MAAETLPAEEWRPIAGHSRYMVSNHGRVTSFAVKREGALMRPTPQYGGYVNVQLRADDGTVSFTRMHVLVAEAFLGPKPSPEMQVRHLNGDPADNRLTNLAWGTPLENSADTRRHGRHPNTQKTHCAQGHPYDDENTKWIGEHRHCRTCRRQWRRNWRTRRAQLAAGIREAS